MVALRCDHRKKHFAREILTYMIPPKIKLVAEARTRLRAVFDRERGRYEPHPRRDWFSILSGAIGFFVIIALLIMAISYHYAPSRIVAIGQAADSNESQPPFDQVQLKKVLRDFAHRRDAFQGLLLATSTAIVDPAR